MKTDGSKRAKKRTEGTRGIRCLAAVLLAATFVVATGGPADAREFPLETHACGDVIDSSFRLANDILGCTGHGLEIERSGITVDLNGHAITHSGTAFGIGISAGLADDLRIRNGTISGFNEGMHFWFSDRNKISGMTLSANGTGIQFLAASVDNEITRNNINNSTYSGISLVNVGDTRPEGNSVSGNTLADNGRGIEVLGAIGNVVTENTIDSNTGLGVQIADSQLTKFKNNVVTDNGDSGVQVLRSQGVRLSGNTVDANARGIKLDNADDALVRKNRVNVNTGHGIQLVNGSSENRIDENRIAGNNSSGLAILASSSFNLIVENIASRNTFAGIVVDSPTNGNRLVANITNENRQNGIEAYSLATISRNVAKKNGFGLLGEDDDIGLGISALAGTTGSGNIARGNDDPNQCKPTSLCG